MRKIDVNKALANIPAAIQYPRTQATMIEKFIDCEIEFIELNKNLFQVKVNLDGKI